MNIIKQKAMILRKKGYTYLEINKALDNEIPKSTLSGWCKNIILTNEQKNRIKAINLSKLLIAQQKSVLSKRSKRNKYLELLKSKNLFLLKEIDRNILKIILSILYICEGAKWKSHRGIMFGNSDPDMIRFFIFLLINCYHVNKNSIRCRVSYRADQDIKVLERFWSRATGIPLIHFFKTKPDPRTIGKITKKSNYKGVCVVTCKGTDIQLELETIARLLFSYNGPVA